MGKFLWGAAFGGLIAYYSHRIVCNECDRIIDSDKPLNQKTS